MNLFILCDYALQSCLLKHYCTVPEIPHTVCSLELKDEADGMTSHWLTVASQDNQSCLNSQQQAIIGDN